MRIGRIRSRAGFAALATRGRRARRGTVRLTAVLFPVADEPATGARAEVAYAVGRALGPAVLRNRVRRRLRATVAELAPRPGLYLVSVTPAAADQSGAELRADLAAALAEVGAIDPARAGR